MNNLTARQKIIRAIPGVIVGSIMIGIISWGISSNIKCNKLLKNDDCVTQMVFSYYSKEHMFGNGSRGVSTGFYLNLNDEKYQITTTGFIKPVPNGIPVIVRYSPKCPDCYEFLWDSTFVYEGYRYRYSYIEDQGYNCDVTKIVN
jgi:hypothetical protein